MQQQWFLATDERNFNVNCEFLKRNLISNSYAVDQSVVCFSHVPKTAGTSLEAILIKNFAATDIQHVNAPDLNQLPEILKLKKSLPKLICGHHPMHGLLYQLLPETPVFHFTQLREPIDRVLSYFNYVKGKNDHPLHKFTVNSTFSEFIKANPSPELSNGQAKRFSGYLHSGQPTDDVLLQQAKDTLSQCFSLVLTTCLFDEGLLLLKNRLNLKDIYYQRSNVSTKFLTRSDLSDSDLKLIQAMNQVDSELFAWAKTNCQNLVKQELNSHDISNFHANNQKWNDLISL